MALRSYTDKVDFRLSIGCTTWNGLPRETLFSVFRERCPVRGNPQFERHDLVGYLAGRLVCFDPGVRSPVF